MTQAGCGNSTECDNCYRNVDREFSVSTLSFFLQQNEVFLALEQLEAYIY